MLSQKRGSWLPRALCAKAVFVMGIAAVVMIGVCCGSANADTIQFTNSDQLNLSGRNVLAAVNFYFDGLSAASQGNNPMTGPLQGVDFENVDLVAGTSGADTNVTLPGYTLTYNLPRLSDGRTQSPTITGPDATQATLFAKGMTFFLAGDSGSLTFDFGAGRANALVEVQIPGGDPGGHANWTGTLEFSVNSVSKGTITGDNNSGTAQLLTFNATTDAFGILGIDIAETGNLWAAFSGATVTIPEPSSLFLLATGLLGLICLRRRRRGKE